MNCIFDIIYTFDNRIKVSNTTTANVRREFCEKVVQKIPSNHNFDLIAPIPETGRLYSNQIAKLSNIPHAEILSKGTQQRTTFLSQSERFKINVNHFKVDRDLIQNKNILLIDETIVTGQTLWLTRRQLLKDGATSVSCALIMPPVKWFCPFGKRDKKDTFYNINNNMRPRYNFHLIYPDEDSVKEIIYKYDFCDLCHF